MEKKKIQTGEGVAKGQVSGQQKPRLGLQERRDGAETIHGRAFRAEKVLE